MDLLLPAVCMFVSYLVLIEGALCPLTDPWVYFEGSCYLFVTTSETWESGKITCRSKSSTLAMVTSEVEQQFLNQHAKPSGKSFWLGATDKIKEGDWVWDANGVPLNYSNWAKGEPNNWRGKQHCVMIRGTNPNLQWDDSSCSANVGYICQAPVPSTTTEQETTYPTTEKDTTYPTTEKDTTYPSTEKDTTYPTTEKVTTEKETTYPTTEKETTFPTTEKDTTYPTTEKETTYPSTEKDTTYPTTEQVTTEKETTYPTTEKETTFPTTEKDTTYPTTEKETTYPSTEQETTYPTTEKDTTYPTTEKDTTYPSTEKDTTYPTTEKVTTEKETTYPTTEKETTYPTTEKDTTYPTTEKDTTYPTTETDTTYPTSEKDTTAYPTTEKETTYSTTEATYSTSDNTIYNSTMTSLHEPDSPNITCCVKCLYVETIEEVETLVVNIKTELRFDKNRTSMHLRSLTSAEDPRPSSARIGYFAVSLLILVVALVVISDVINMYVFIKTHACKIK